jgi:hypothetical protein
MPPTFLSHLQLDDLRPLQLTDLPKFRQAIASGQQQGWNYYFPYLLFVRLGSQSTRYLWEEQAGSICVYRHNLADKARLDLAFPPFPYQQSVFQLALERVNDFNRSHVSRVYFIDDQECSHIRSTNLFKLNKRNPQYLFSPLELSELAGSRFQNLRRKLSLVSRQSEVSVEPYGPEHSVECRQLLADWEKQKGQIARSLFFQQRYALNTFHFAPQLDSRDLHGFVYLINDHVRGFTFGGEIRQGVGCLLLSIADSTIPSLSYYIRQHFIANMHECRIVNDGSDGGDAGLGAMKQRFRPCRLHTVYTGKQVSGLPYRKTRTKRILALESNSTEPHAEITKPELLKPHYPRALYECRPSRMIPDQVGLFALKAFAPEEIVVPYAFFDESRLVSWQEFETLDDATRHKLIQYCFKTKKGLYAPRDINSIGVCYFVNHSCDPNLRCKKNGDYVALRKIQKDEELTADLEKNMKKSYTQFACACQADNCRKIVYI